MNVGTAKYCTNCQSPLPKAAPVPKPRPKPRALPVRPQRRISPVLLGLLALTVVVCAVFFFLSMRTEELIGRVSDTRWERTVYIEALGPVEREDWQDEIPVDGVVGFCQDEVRYTSAFPEPNSEEVCGTPYTVDTGTGIGEVVQDCEYLVYDDYCSYTVDEWQVIDQRTASGNDFAPEWPLLNLGFDQREGAREEQYTVTIATDGRSYTYQPDSLQEYQQFDIGSRWILEVNTFNTIMSVSPAN